MKLKKAIQEVLNNTDNDVVIFMSVKKIINEYNLHNKPRIYYDLENALSLGNKNRLDNGLDEVNNLNHLLNSMGINNNGNYMKVIRYINRGVKESVEDKDLTSSICSYLLINRDDLICSK